MSEIPYVDRLGDAIEEAVAKPERARRRRRRRFGGLAVAVFLLGAGGVTIAEILDDPEKLASGEVACYSEATLEPDVISVQSVSGRSPTAACAEIMHTDEPLVACVHHDFVAVFPGRDTCARLGLKPLPAGYEEARAKVARLRREIRRLMAAGDCVPADRLARQVQRVLGRSDWRGWRTRVSGEGPCGAFSGLDEDRRVVDLLRSAPRSLERFVAVRFETLMTTSGRRCFDIGSLRRHIRRTVAAAERPLRFRLRLGPLEEFMDLDPASRNRRFEEGCAVFEGLDFDYPRPGAIVLVAEIRLKRR